MLAQMLDPNDVDRHYVDITKSDQIVLFMNNLGGVSVLELAGITAEICKQLQNDYGLTPVRVISGAFLTSLNGMGFSASILKLADTGLGKGKSMLELLDLPAEAVGWAAPIKPEAWDADNKGTMEHSDKIASQSRASNLTLDPQYAFAVLSAGLDRMIKSEPDVTKYDTIVGDGDCGIGLKRGAEAVLEELTADQANLPTDAVAFVNKIVPVVEETMDGTSGAIYAIFLNALVHGLTKQDSGSKQAVTAKTWAAALQSSLQTLAKYTPAQRGDRTLMDALMPFAEALSDTGHVNKAAQAAKKGAEETKGMKASLGRAVYVGNEEDWMGKVPDPGAWGLAEFLEGLAAAS